MTANGQPDNARSARYVLKDYVNGKLLYCLAPPGVDQSEYHTWPERKKLYSANRVLPPREVRAINVGCSVVIEIFIIFQLLSSVGYNTDQNWMF